MQIIETEQLKKILRDFAKTIKVVSLYPDDNPLPQSLRQSFGESFEQVATEYGDIQIEVEEDHLLCGGDIVYRDRGKDDSLARLLFSSGINRFAVNSALEYQTVQAVLDAFKAYLNRDDTSVDLVDMLWEKELSGFSFETVENRELLQYKDLDELIAGLGEGGAAALSGTGNTLPYPEIFNTDPEEFQNAGALDFFDLDADQNEILKSNLVQSAMGCDDVVGAVNKHVAAIVASIDRAEAPDQLKAALVLDREFNPHRSALELLKEILLQETDYPGFDETVTICDKIQLEFLKEGFFEEAAELLECLRKLRDDLAPDLPMWSERIETSLVTAASRDTFGLIGESLNEHELVSGNDLETYLREFEPDTLGTIADLLAVCEHRHHRFAVCNHLSREGGQRLGLLSKGMYDKRWYVVRNTVMILGAIGNDEALGYLKEAFDHPEKRVRLQMAESLSDAGGPQAAALLGKLTYDADSDIRRRAVRSLTQTDSADALRVIRKIIAHPRFRQTDPVDQKLLLQALSKLGRGDAVQQLERLARKADWFRNRSQQTIRAASIQALAANESPHAKVALEQMGKSWRSDLRRLARRALKQDNEVAGESTP